jgi:choice-of-anchor B domain-containing protein
MRPSCRIVLRLSAACLLAAGLAAPSRIAEACHTYDHAQHLRGVGIGVPEEVMQKLKAIPVDFEPIVSPALGATPCVGGMADIYPCENVDLLAFVPLASMGGAPGDPGCPSQNSCSGNDLWGWTDPVTGVEWALMGRTNGTAFISLEDPTAPVYVGNLPTQTGSSSWRDIKVFDNHAFIVSDNNGAHGIQVFDLTVLRTIISPPVTFNPATDLAAHYTGLGEAHNIAINEDTGFAYAVGDPASCGGGGLHMVDINDPANPTFAGCYSGDGYTHDVQCVVYQGIDEEHLGDEICFASNEDTLTIVDVTNKSAPALLSRNAYAGSGYTHQGWLTPDQRFFLVDDELDHGPGEPRRTYVWYLDDLEAPTLLGNYEATGLRAPAIDHNQYVLGDVAFQSNYRAGLSVLRIDDPATAGLTEVGYFDTYPDFDNPSFSGAWSNYPYFASGIVIVSDINRGLFVLQPNLPVNPIIFHDDFELGDPTAWSAVVP